MSDLINGKTSEEIKNRTFECFKTYACRLCKYGDTECHLGVVLGDALALIERLEAAQLKWISVKERLPENGETVIGFTPCDGFMFVGYYRTSQLESYRWSSWYIITALRSEKKMTKKVTHWMPLPEPPEEDVHEED